jgi:hypothetical protein
VVQSEIRSRPAYTLPVFRRSLANQLSSFIPWPLNNLLTSGVFARADDCHASFLNRTPIQVQDRHFAGRVIRGAALIVGLGISLAWGQPPVQPKAREGTLTGLYRVVKTPGRTLLFPPNVEESTDVSVFLMSGAVRPPADRAACVAKTSSGAFSFKIVDEQAAPPLPVNPASSAKQPNINKLAGQVSVSIGPLLKAEKQGDLLRSELHEFAGLLVSLDHNCLPPEGFDSLFSRLTEKIPSSLANSLFLAFGLDAADKRGRILVQPGMRLRVENATYQRSPTKEGTYGYVVTGSQLLNVNRSPAVDDAT